MNPHIYTIFRNRRTAANPVGECVSTSTESPSEASSPSYLHPNLQSTQKISTEYGIVLEGKIFYLFYIKLALFQPQRVRSQGNRIKISNNGTRSCASPTGAVTRRLPLQCTLDGIHLSRRYKTTTTIAPQHCRGRACPCPDVRVV